MTKLITLSFGFLDNLIGVLVFLKTQIDSKEDPTLPYFGYFRIRMTSWERVMAYEMWQSIYLFMYAGCDLILPHNAVSH